MYFSPLLLLTSDLNHNKKIARIVSSNFQHFKTRNLKLYETTTTQDLQSLHVILYIESLLLKIYIDASQCNFNTVNKPKLLPQIDEWRLREKIKKILSTIKRACIETVNIYDSSTNLEKIQGDSEWDLPSDPDFWHVSVMEKFATRIHMCISFLEKDILLGKNNEMQNKLDDIVKSTENIHGQLKEYIRLVNSI